jgi:hypothetical protein
MQLNYLLAFIRRKVHFTEFDINSFEKHCGECEDEE